MLKDKNRFSDNSLGYLALFCPVCGYSIEESNTTRNFTYCLHCARKNLQNKLESRLIITFPEYEVIAPFEMARRAMLGHQ